MLVGDGYRGKTSPHTPNEKFEGATVLKALKVKSHCVWVWVPKCQTRGFSEWQTQEREEFRIYTDQEQI